MSASNAQHSPSSQQHGNSQTREDAQARIAVTVFPVLVIIAFLLALFMPTTFAPMAAYTNWALGIIMFGMGLTLTVPDFALVVKRPLPVLIGVLAQFIIMPTIAFLLVTVFNLPEAVAVGVILVGCAPGGTSSNVISYLSKGDVALSVTMTSISTLLAPLMTPVLTKMLAGAAMEVSVSAMAMSIVKMVLVPVIGGLVIRLIAARFVEKILPALPWISVLGICYVVMAVVSKSADKILTAGLMILLVVVCHNLLGYLLGYFAGKIGRGNERACRTTSVEVGMQNSGLAATLAATHFSATPETALPGAIFSVWHNISGALLAMYYRRRPLKD
ncbi:bile acid:sodium symporter family protein [Schaalia vaccimaxillae]|uniref:bile acid:sodium symporter family protein n=1 Tax=Schaalia vaccimaxillae TaxID=183916 RepID=UPI0004159AA6|nr:bile acid:sodium symporter family protein [Schaalia vaccimaxillae]